MVKHNNEIPHEHFKKDWDKRVKTWFDQPGRKKRRHNARVKRALTVAPRPADGLLRPIVHPPTLRYNMRQRLGRGFTLEELKEAGIPKKKAMSIGICVDHRRQNDSVESLQLNAQRLKEYLARLVVFPRKAKHPKKGDSPAEQLAQAKQLKGVVLPIQKKTPRPKARLITEEDKKKNSFLTLRRARADLRFEGARARRAELKKEQDALKAKGAR